MKGVIQQNLILQKVSRQDKITNQINQFEKCDYLEIGGESTLQKYIYRIQMQESISLQQLIKLYSSHYILLYKEILSHLNQLHQQKLSHGYLLPKNILIRLGNQTGFSITYKKVIIKQIHFIRYKYIEDRNYKMNIQMDLKQISLSMIEFIDMMLNKYSSCETLQFLKSHFKQENLYQKDVQYLLNLLQHFQAIYFNKAQQKFEINEIDGNIDSQFFGLIQPIRERYESIIIDYLKELNKQNLNTEISIQKIRNDLKQLQDLELLDIQSKKYEMLQNQDLKLMEIIQNSLKMSVLIQFCVDVGRYFQQNQSKPLEELLVEFEKNVNNQLQIFYETVLPQIFNVDYVFDSIYEEQQKNMQKSFTFKFAKPNKETKVIYSQEWQLALQNQDIFNFNFIEFKNSVRENVRNQL